jgi:hypothetical protein
MGREDEISQAERRRILQEERRAKTYLAEAQANTDLELGGRFAKLPRATFVGAGPSVKYPRLPANSPWHSDPCPPEPPLGIDINAMDAVGEAWEQEASRGDAAAPEPKKAGWRRF